MEKNYSDDFIRDNYSEIIEGLILNYDYTKEEYAISLIRTILECGVDEFDFNKIEFICMKFMDIKNLKSVDGSRGYSDFRFSNNKTIINEAIRFYNQKQANFNNDDDYDDDYEIICDNKQFSR